MWPLSLRSHVRGLLFSQFPKTRHRHLMRAVPTIVDNFIRHLGGIFGDKARCLLLDQPIPFKSTLHPAALIDP